MSPLIEALLGSFFGGVCLRIACSLMAAAVLDRTERR